jgi:porin
VARGRATGVSSRALVVAVCIATALLAGSAASAGAEVSGVPGMAPFSFFDEAAAIAAPDRAFLTGDWGGLRTRLLDLGITPSLAFVTDVLGNPTGGRGRGLRESDELALSLTADLERLAGWAGARFQLSFSMRSGTSLSDSDIGNVFTVAQVCCGHTYRLVHVALEQSLLEERVSLRGGRIAAGDEFLSSPLYGNFVQGAFNANPMGILFNVPMTAYPTATWGMRARVRPISQLSLMAGVYNGDPTLGDNDKHGVDWTMRGPLFAIAEVGVHLNQEPGATGLPGNYKIGGYYLAGEVPDLHRDVHGGSIALSGLPPQMHDGTGGFYILLDQMIYRDGGAGSQRGLTPFVSLLVAPNSSVNTMPFFANGGLVYQGLFPSRPHDTAAFGVAYGAFSRQLARSQRDARSAGSGAGIQQYEIALELTYIVQATKWLQVQPDLQYIINPGGTGRIPNALVLGFQLALTL